MRHSIKVAWLLGILASAPPTFADPLQDAIAAESRGEHERADPIFRALAEQGSAVAQYHLGAAYEDGQGVPQDYAQAMVWYRKAAAQGNTDAQFSVGALYQKGQGVPEDDAQAVAWFRKAADAGVGTAQTMLGICYSTGKGVPQDDAKAAFWYLKSANQGDASDQLLVASLYAGARGVPLDNVQALKWYDLAIWQDLALWQAGDSVLARMLTQPRDEVAGHMTTAQVAEAHRQEEAWKTDHPAVKPSHPGKPSDPGQ